MLLSSSNRKYQPFPLLSYFSVVVFLRCLLHHILSRISYTFRENWDFVFIIIVQVMMSANSRIHYGLQILFVSLYITPSHYHHCANLSADIELWNVWQIYFVECVSKIEHILLVIYYSIYGAVFFQFTRFPHDGWENILFCLIITIKSEVWTIIHCLGLGHETMVCAACLFIFLFLEIRQSYDYLIPQRDL